MGNIVFRVLLRICVICLYSLCLMCTCVILVVIYNCLYKYTVNLRYTKFNTFKLCEKFKKTCKIL